MDTVGLATCTYESTFDVYHEINEHNTSGNELHCKESVFLLFGMFVRSAKMKELVKIKYRRTCSAWFINSSLSEFQELSPVQLQVSLYNEVW
jgi:hypothetical protein